MSPSEQSITIDRIQDLTITSEPVIHPIIDHSRLQERGLAFNLQKSLSARLTLPYSPAPSESDSSKTSSPKSCYNPVRKFFNPFVKSKSQRSTPSSANNASRERNSRDIGSKPHTVEHNSHSGKKENQSFFHQHSPSHLHGFLRLENKHEMPFFEFSVKSPDDIYVAKTWKIENTVS